jgi:hypothetical protein
VVAIPYLKMEGPPFADYALRVSPLAATSPKSDPNQLRASSYGLSNYGIEGGSVLPTSFSRA